MATTDSHKAILAETIGHQRDYAKRCDADYSAVTSDDQSFPIQHYRKLDLISDALTKYDRVAWIDADILISKKAPSIFDEVPEGKLGIFNEATWIDRSKDAAEWKELTGFELPANTYYNTGVMVVEKIHSGIFDQPDVFINHYGEQTYLNMMIAKSGVKIHKLSHHFNRMSCTHFGQGEEPFVSNFIHFAGQNQDPNLPKFIKQTVEHWAKKDWQGERTIGVVCNNGLGNQASTVPVIEYLAKTHPEHKIVLQTSFPEVFEHLKSNQISVIDENGVFPNKFTLIKSTALLGTIADVLAHPTDFHSISLLQRQLPLDARRITVPKATLKTPLPPGTCLLHCGKSGWPSKQMPIESWQEIVDRLKSANIPVGIIGLKDFKKKNRNGSEFWGCFVPENIDFDLTDISYAETCEAINQCAFLLSNDSAPIHMGGATDNPWLGLITIAKRPELIFPYRNGKQDYKTISWTGVPLWDVVKEPVIYSPDSQFSWAQMHSEMCFPKPEEVANDIIRILRDENNSEQGKKR